MLKGDLTSTPLAPLLLDLAADSATGCLSVSDGEGEEALVYLKAGLIYAISVPGSRPQLGAKLVSSGALAPEALAEALDAQRTELQGWRLGELLVHLGYVDQPVVEAFVKEQVHEALWDLMRWNDGRWRFRKNSKTREDVGPPMIVVELLESLRERGYEWQTISAVVHGPHAVPMLSARGDSAAETTLDNDAWSMLCKIDGQRTVSELARDCGYTLFEAGHVIVSLVKSGLVDIDEDIDVEGAEMYGASTLASAWEPEAPAEDDDDAMTRLARLVTEVAGEGSTADGPDAGEDGGSLQIAPAQRQPEPELAAGSVEAGSADSMMMSLPRGTTESFAASIARVSGALADVLGPPPEAMDDIDPLLETRKVARPNRGAEDEGSEWERRRRLRSAAAAELVNAQALADALRPDRNTTDELPQADAPRLIDDAIAAKRAEEEAERNAAEEAAREAAERFARAAADEAERHAADEAARLAADRAAEENARLAAEQEAAAEAARLAAEEAERLAAEQAERLAAEQAERLAAEQAATLAAEVEAAEIEAWAEYWQREEADRAEREEEQRLAAEQAERLAAAEAERLAAEEAERVAAEEAERFAAEEAERLAAAEAERLAAEEAERVAAEQAAQLAAELEAAQLAEQAAAQEAARLAAEELQRLATEEAEEAQRLAAEAEQQAAEEAERKAQEKAERIARRKAEKAAAAEEARREDEAAAAHAMLIELNASATVEEPAAEPEPAPVVDNEPVPEPVPVGVGARSDFPEQADTAALLRELSSLGLEDDEPSALSTPINPRGPRAPVADEKKARKKIGLFGL